MAKQTITITIDPDDQQATASSIKSGLMQSSAQYEQAFPGDSFKASYDRQKHTWDLDFNMVPRSKAFRYVVKGNVTHPIKK